MPVTRDSLLAAAKALCADFASTAPLPTLLSHFSSTHQVSAHEHGLPLLAPFLGRTFSGREGIEEYFTLLQKYLTYENMSFGEYTVDPSVQRVSCKGTARFKWIEGEGNGEWWDETFAYILDFDDEGKVTSYQVWADSGAAYLARTGQLSALKEKYAEK